MVLLFHLSTDYSDYSAHNSGWNGTSQFFSALPGDNTVIIEDNSQLEQYHDSVLLIIAPGRNVSDSDGLRYREFLGRGNTIVLFDDFGSGNDLLRQFGTDIRIRRTTLLSADQAFNDPVFVKAYPVGSSDLTGNISAMTMDRPSVIEGGEMFLVTSLLSWEDTNSNKKADSNETIGRFVVGSEDRAGTGRIIVVSDPGVLINSIAATDTGLDRDRFIDTLLHLNRTVLVDQVYSMTADTTPSSRIIHIIQTTSSIRISVLTILFVILLIGFWKRIW
jgi:hypothetical protein